MIAEVSLFGIFVSGALATACLAGIALFIIRRLFLRLGFYQLLWHPHLVDVALFTILWAAAAMTIPALSGLIERVW
jgi:protein AaeX